MPPKETLGVASNEAAAGVRLAQGGLLPCEVAAARMRPWECEADLVAAARAERPRKGADAGGANVCRLWAACMEAARVGCVGAAVPM